MRSRGDAGLVADNGAAAAGEAVEEVDLPTLGRPTIARTASRTGTCRPGEPPSAELLRGGRDAALPQKTLRGQGLAGNPRLKPTAEFRGEQAGGHCPHRAMAGSAVGLAGGSGASTFLSARPSFFSGAGACPAADGFPFCLDFALRFLCAFAVALDGFQVAHLWNAADSGRRSRAGTLVHYREGAVGRRQETFSAVVVAGDDAGAEGVDRGFTIMN